jgi:hypothetical protein
MQYFLWGVGYSVFDVGIRLLAYNFSDDSDETTTSNSAVVAINTLSTKVEDLTDRINTIVGVSSNT